MSKNVSDKKVELSAAEELIREVSEGVIARNLPSRRRKNKHGHAQSESPVGQAPLTAAAVPEAPSAQSRPAEPPVLKQTPPEPAVLLPRSDSGPRDIVALICYEDPAGPIGVLAGRMAESLARRGHAVHVFARKALAVLHGRLRMHEVGDSQHEGLVERIQDFSQRVQGAFRQNLGNGNGVSLLGFEWAAIPSLIELATELSLPSALSLHSLESMRADMSSEISKRIQEIEHTGLRQTGWVLLHDAKTQEHALRLLPECKDRIAQARQPFPTHEFKGIEDAGAVKARIQVGPIDPLVLFVGDLDERHGPDVLMKSVVPVLKNHKQARFAFVGDGALQWPLRVHSRYLLLEYAVRFLGHVDGQQLLELVQAADVICAPSRERTEDWPILAAWAAKKPVVASHDVANGMIQHEQNGLLIYPSESSCVWGIERALFSAEICQHMGENGHRSLDEKFGWSTVALQLEELLSLKAGAAN